MGDVLVTGLKLLFTIGATILEEVEKGSSKATMVRMVASVVARAAVIDHDVDDVAAGKV